nr:hypothetical protein [Arthrobacter sp. ISL-30]
MKKLQASLQFSKTAGLGADKASFPNNERAWQDPDQLVLYVSNDNYGATALNRAETAVQSHVGSHVKDNVRLELAVSDLSVKRPVLRNEHFVSVQPQSIHFLPAGSDRNDFSPHAAGQLQSMDPDPTTSPCYEDALPGFHTTKQQCMISGTDSTSGDGGIIERHVVRDASKAQFIHYTVFGVTAVQGFAVELALHTEDLTAAEAVPAAVAGLPLRGRNPITKMETAQTRTHGGDPSGDFMPHDRAQDAINFAASSHDVLAAYAAGFNLHEHLTPSRDRDIPRSLSQDLTPAERFKRVCLHHVRNLEPVQFSFAFVGSSQSVRCGSIQEDHPGAFLTNFAALIQYLNPGCHNSAVSLACGRPELHYFFPY